MKVLPLLLLLPFTAALAANGPVLEDNDSLYPADQLLTGDDRWGCELLLCLANPNGWNTVAECRPPVERYFDCSTKRHNPCSMPKCPQSGAGNYATRNDGVYDPCKLMGDGYQEAPRGYLYKGRFTDGNRFRRSGNRYYTRYGSSYNWNGEHEECDSEGCRTYSTKACVKPSAYQGIAYERYSCKDSDGYSRTCTRSVRVYDDIVWQREQPRHAIDIYIEGQLYNRVHY